MDTLDLLKSLTEGVNKKVEQEEDIEYKVNTSLKGTMKKKVTDKETDENNSGHIFEEKKSINLDEKLNVNKSKINRGGNPFKRGPRSKKVSDNISEQSSYIPLDVVDKNEGIDTTYTDIVGDSEIIEDLNCTEEIVELQDISEEIVEDLLPNTDEIVNSEYIDDEIISEEGLEEIVELEESSEEIVDLKEEPENLLPNSSVDLKETLDTELKEPVIVEENFDLSFDFSEIEETENSEKTEDIEFNESEGASNEAFENLEESDTSVKIEEFDKSEDILDLDIEDSNIEPEENQEDAKFNNCVYYKGMDVEEFLRENPNYRDTIFVEHFYSKEVINKLLYSGMIHIRKGQYRL